MYPPVQSIMGERYTYQELSAGAVTRVFILGPSETFDAPLKCILQEVFDLGKPPKYDALSYVCGPSTGDQHVLCDGKTMPITKNCELALRYLRDKVQPRTLWVDSICIDQDPKSADKSIQIPRMGDIYQLADRVYVWLGEPSSDTARLFRKIRCLGRVFYRTGFLHNCMFLGLTINRCHWIRSRSKDF